MRAKARSFLEALASKTPVISGENPDNLVSDYGYHVKDDDFESGLDWLLKSEDYKNRGIKGRRHMEQVYEVNRVVDLHIAEYEKIEESG